ILQNDSSISYNRGTGKGSKKMRLFENLRKAEKKGVQVMRQGMARAREEWEDVERRIRQRMRVYPQKFRKSIVAAAARSRGELRPDVPTRKQLQATEPSKPIISVHGRDIRDEEIDHPAA
ncbi:MAG TPA: hypothetical protein VI685_09060, partial [Candidatus Angelobacter sp.]